MNKKNITIEETYAAALKNHKKSNFTIAEELYKEILKINPEHFESNFLLGTLSVQLNKIDMAKELFEKSIQIKPNHSNANCTNINYKFNRAVLFNSDYFHETDEINFDENYESRRINITYLFGYRFNKKMNED